MRKCRTDNQQPMRQGLQDASKKLYRTVGEQTKRLDEIKISAKSIQDLFTAQARIQRRKLCEYCERLIFQLGPFARKAEEILWRKVYYEPVSAAKKLRPPNTPYSADEVYQLQAHINAGIGFYQHLLARYQSEEEVVECEEEGINEGEGDDRKEEQNEVVRGRREYGVDLVNVTDFCLENDGFALKSKPSQSIHQCLIYLGDLNRYRLEFQEDYTPQTALRYYSQAAQYRPESGMPHNQMGTLAMSRGELLSAVFRYLRGLACDVPFEGTIDNLKSVFEKNSKKLEHLHKESGGNCGRSDDFEVKFLQLIDTWFFNKKLPKFHSVCQQTVTEFEEYLQRGESPTKNNNDISSQSFEETEKRVLKENVFKITIVCLLCITKLEGESSNQVPSVVQFALNMFLILMKKFTENIRNNVLKYSPIQSGMLVGVPYKGIAFELLKIRNKNARRRNCRRRAESDDDSDSVSLSEDSEDISSDDEEEVEDENDNELSDTSSSEADDDDDSIEKIHDKYVETVQKLRKINVNTIMDWVTEEPTFISIKVFADWFCNRSDVIKSSYISKNIFKQITDLLNCININVRHPELNLNFEPGEVVKNSGKIALPEDVLLNGSKFLEKSNGGLDWSFIRTKNFNHHDETLIRIVKIMGYCKSMIDVKETGIFYHDKKHLFMCKYEVANNTENTEILGTRIDISIENEKKMNKMKHMGQLWLASEVTALENSLKGKPTFSPYLILDCDALIKHTFMVKQLVNSRKFIVIVPSAVVSALDYLKREKSEARDAIRWLEAQFHRGNRFFRAQRPSEKLSIPLIKYPKKRDKEMAIYIEIIECCYFLSEQNPASDLVTLLIGNQNVLSNGENKDFSYGGLAESAGVKIEIITQFHARWKKSCKNSRR